MLIPISHYEAKGGLPPSLMPKDHTKDMREEDDPANPGKKIKVWTGHTYDRTRAGHYTLRFAHQHATKGWFFSRIPFGAKLHINPKDPMDVLWEDRNHKRHSIKKTLGLTPKNDVPVELIKKNDILTRNMGGIPTGKFPDFWPFNDFGHAVWYLFDGKNQRSEQMMHETPENERAALINKTPGQPKVPVTLDYSHGCNHIKPDDMDEMMAKRYLVNGTRFVVHGYGRPKPHGLKYQPMFHARHYVLHFYPHDAILIVFGFK
jgi:hypothetical protein